MSSKMRPDAAMFSPRISTPSSNNDLAVIPYDNVNGEDDVNKAARKFIDKLFGGTDPSPKEMIMHETIKGLLGEVSDLNIRCNRLEVANASLKEAMSAIEQACAANASNTKSNGNLTGYASSDSDSEEDRGHSTTSREVNEKFDTIQMILQFYKQQIEAQGAQQQDLKNRFERKSQDQTMLKGRIGAIEKNVKDLKAELDNSDFSKKAGTSASEVGTYLADELQQQQLRLTDLETRCREAHNELYCKCEVLTTVVEGGGALPAASGVQPAASNMQLDTTQGKAPKASKQDIVDLKKWQGNVRRQTQNNMSIDEAATRDSLYAMFFQLSEIMNKGDGATLWCEGPFQATSDEAFQLRDRVICRLALYDRYAAALEEVQSKKDQIDW